MNWYNKWLWQKSMAWVNKDKKIAYRNIGKNASSSMKQILKTVGFKWIHQYSDDSNYFTFAIVREPIDRFVSGFISVLSKETERKNNGNPHHDFIFKYKSIDDLLVDFVDQIERIGFFDDHILPQKYTISDTIGNLHRIDMFILYERLQKDFAKIKAVVGEDIKLIHINKINNYQYFPNLLTKDGTLSEIKERLKKHIQENKGQYGLLRMLKKLYLEDFMLYEYVKAGHYEN